MQTIPLQSVPNQQLQIVLGGQNCQISVYVRSTWIFMDLNVNGTDISIATLARNAVALVPTAYLGFSGQLAFFDTQGATDPVYTGLGTRYQLAYFTAAELASGQVTNG